MVWGDSDRCTFSVKVYGVQPRLMNVEDPLEELLDGHLPLHTNLSHEYRDTPHLTGKFIYCNV